MVGKTSLISMLYLSSLYSMGTKFFWMAVVTIAIVLMSLSFSRPAEPVEKLFHAQVEDLLHKLETFNAAIENKGSQAQLKSHFNSCRLAYKRSSILVDYFFPILHKNINGPDLRYAEEDNPDVIYDPHGFQVIERIIYHEVDYKLLQKECTSLIEIFRSINEQPELSYKLRDELVFDAMRSAVIRLVALGITGFDSPVALNSLNESRAVLAGMMEILKLYNDQETIAAINNADKHIVSNSGFNSFDRLTFIREFADPVYASLVRKITLSGMLLPVERRPLNQMSASLFSDSLFDIGFFSPNERYRMNAERITLGKYLFYDSIFSLSVDRTCASCHNPSKSFTDGLKVPAGISAARILKRNTPTLLGAAFQTKFFYDSRASTLENQLNTVVHNIDEMNGSLREGIERIEENQTYSELFRKAYPNDRMPVTEYNIANAISSYVRSLSTFNTKFDRFMRGEGTLTKNEKRGFNLFAGKAKCATCHFIPLFNGLVPPQFSETESEVLGVPMSAGENVVDDDPGKFAFTRSTINMHAFKTPTLRNVTTTSPYMHNGVYNTLEEVMDFYNKGGGAGLNIHLDNQTLPAEPLHLTKKEIKYIIAFLGTLND